MKVRSPITSITDSRITKNTLYEAFDVTKNSFIIKDDNGDHCFCLFEGCAHIQHNDWIVVEDNKKETNPKDSVGIKKPPKSTVSAPVMAEVGIAMMEGARKYGRHNYRVAKVKASVYYDATDRHLSQWWEGEDIDPDSGLSHITKAISSLMVLRDAMICDKLVDDRPPKAPEGWLRNLQSNVDDLFEKYPTSVEPYTEENSDYDSDDT